MGKTTLNRKTLAVAAEEEITQWFIYGAEGEGGAGGNNPPADDDDDDDDDDDEGDDPDAGMDPKDKRIRDLSAEARSRRKELRTVQKQLKELQDGQQAEADKKKSNEDQQASKITQLEAKIEKMDKASRKNFLETGILKATDSKNKPYSWHDVDMVVAALDMSEIDIDVESGTVEGLSEELKRVAKEKPFLLKSNAKDGEDEGKSKRGASGSNPGGAGNRQHDQRTTDRDRLIEKYKIRR